MKNSTDMAPTEDEKELACSTKTHISWNKRFLSFVKYLILNIVYYFCIASRINCLRRWHATVERCAKKWDSRIRWAECWAPWKNSKRRLILFVFCSSENIFPHLGHGQSDFGSNETGLKQNFQFRRMATKSDKNQKFFNRCRSCSASFTAFLARRPIQFVHRWCKRQTRTRIMTQCNIGKHQHRNMYTILKGWQKQQYQQRNDDFDDTMTSIKKYDIE